ncbi:TPA_asm: polyprotein [Silene virus 1]|uniref:RNA-directed RNA polymerase n=1 Tax=Silene virus 1 TaxID=2977989 RepID=A0A9N7AAN3_9RHAB|nr:TPA_asm: polyprotein [Silene virus 1]
MEPGGYFEEDEIVEADEQVMTDLHLGNAINLDHVEYLVTKKWDKYNIFIAEYQKRQWQEVFAGMGYPRKMSIGLLRPTQDFLLMETGEATIMEQLYKSLVRIIGKSLRQRNMHFPLAQCYEELASMRIVCKRSYMYMFRFITQLVCMVSESARGGSHSVYNDIHILDGHVRGDHISGETSWSIAANNSFCILLDKRRKKYYAGSFDSLLLIMDTVGQRLCLDIGNQVCARAGVPGSSPRSVLDQIISICDEVLRTYGNDGYEFIGMYEALVVSVLLKKNPDPVTDSNEFYLACKQEVQELVEDGKFGNDLVVLFETLAEYMMELDSSALSNLFCLYRIWGHPRVDVYAGMEKVMKKATEVKEAPGNIPLIILCQFRKMFLMEFFSKHHRYPPCLFSGTERTYIQSCIEGDHPISVDNAGYNVLDFEKLEVKQIWELPETYDVCHILNDKAVSPNRSELYESLRAGKGTVMGVNRRGIIRWLTSKSLRCKEFLEEIDVNGLDEDSLIIGMYEKEREIKVKARMFSLMSEKMRMYFVLTEEMIAENLLKYFPQITMKDPLNVIIKKLWNVSGRSHEMSLDPIINIDFEKWNLNMRDELTRPLFEQMDKLFGFNNLIARTHEIFANSFIYSSSGKYAPPVNFDGLITDPPMCYIGHMGGLEGLRQKGWTVGTVCLLCYLADRYNLKINLLGQGDNQVVRIYMPQIYWANLRFSEEEMVIESKRLLNSFVEGMNTYFDAAGLPIKVRETWKSTRLYMYGKNMYLDGKSLPQWNKKILRSYALSNEGTLTISGVVGTIATNMCAAAHASEKPDILYVVYLILGEWSLEYLLAYHPFTRKSIRENDTIDFEIPGSYRVRRYPNNRINRNRLKATILMIPTAVGGSVTIPLFGFIIRGFPDNGTEGYSWLKMLGEVDSAFQKMFRNWYSFLCNPTAELDMLLQVPWALNHQKPPTPSLRSRDAVRDWLTSGTFSQNTFLSNATSILSRFNRKEVARILVGKRINPLILGELYASFAHVYLDGIIQRVEKTRTVKKLSLKTTMRKPIIKEMMRFEHEFLGYLYWRGFQTGEIFSECATKHCREARNVGWGREIKGLTTPHPMEFLFTHTCSNLRDNCDGSDFIYCRISEEGNFPPYLGSRVRTKVMSLQDIALRNEPLVVVTAKMMRFSKWLNLGPNAMHLLRTNLNVVCDQSLFSNVEDQSESVHSGSIEHRFNPAGSSEGCYINYSPQVGSRVFMSSDNMPELGRGGKNVTIHYQAAFCMIQYNSSYDTESHFHHYHIKCRDCVVPVDDDVDDIGDMSEVLDVLYSDVYVDLIRETLGFINRRVDTFEDVVPTALVDFKTVLPNQISQKRMRSGLHALLALRSAMMIMYSRPDTVSLIGYEDLQAFPRVYAYKVSGSLLIKLVIEFLFVIKMVRSDEVPSVRGFSEIRNKLINQVMKISLERFKGIASLCIGRTFRNDDDVVIPQLNLGEFPEDPGSFLRAVRAEIIDQLNAKINVHHFGKVIQIPSVGLSAKEKYYLLVHSLLRSERCTDCTDSIWKTFRERNVFVDCAERHIRKANNRVTTVPIPTDIAIKGSALEKHQSPPIPVIGTTAFETLNTIGVEIDGILRVGELDLRELKNLVQDFRSSLQVRLPTCALYKWDFMLSQITHLNVQHVIVFGDGVGETSLICARRFPGAKIHPTALMEKTAFIPQDLMSIKPFMSRHCDNVSGSLIEKVVDNIYDTRWTDQVERYIHDLKGNILMVSDVEEEFGNWRLTAKLLDVAKRVGGRCLHMFKVYIHEGGQFPFGEFVYTNSFCNAHYLEGFLTDIDLEVEKESMLEVFSVERWSKECKRAGIETLARFKEFSFPEMAETSNRIARHILNRSFLNLSEESMKYPRQVLLYKHLKYIGNNFLSPFQYRGRDDNRRMLDATLVKVVVGLKMLLVVLFGKRILDLDYIKKLSLVKARKRNRIDLLIDLPLSLVQIDEEFMPSKRETTAAEVLRLKYKELSGAGDVVLPGTLFNFLEQEVAVGCMALKRYGSMYPDC